MRKRIQEEKPEKEYKWYHRDNKNMSVVSSFTLRTSRQDFVPMSIQYMKRTRDGSEKTTPIRPPRAINDLFDESNQTISSSTVSSLLYKGLTKEQFCWKLRDYYNKNKPVFPMLTKIIFMPGGNVFEDFVLNEMEKVLKQENIIRDDIKKQYNRDEIPRTYENDLLSRLNRQNYYYETRDGFTNETSADLSLFGRKIVSRTDGILPDYVVEAKVPFGKLYKKYGSGTIVKEDGTKEYDKTKEIFEIPIHYKLQMLIQMNCYNKRKALFGQYYIFENWKSFTDLLKRQYEKIQRGASFMPGEVIYKPSLDITTPILTIINRIVKVIQRHVPILSDVQDALLTSTEKRQRAAKEKEYQMEASSKVWKFLTDYCDYRIQQPLVPTDKEITSKLTSLERKKQIDNTQETRLRISILKIQLLESYADRFKTAVEEIFRKNPRFLNNILTMTNFQNLSALTENPSEKTAILNILQYGQKKDIRRGVIAYNGNIMWDGDSMETEMPSKDILISWIKDLFRIVLPRVSRKDAVKWKAFEEECVKNNNLDFSLYPNMNTYGQFTGYGEYNELVILEMDMTKTYEEAMTRFKQFLYQCERTVKYWIPCKSTKRKDPITGKPITDKMTFGTIDSETSGYREQFMKFLKNIPTKMVARREVQI